nr:hypothetical protein Iba_chr12eCG9050 [Ipomoea batatas]
MSCCLLVDYVLEGEKFNSESGLNCSFHGFDLKNSGNKKSEERLIFIAIRLTESQVRSSHLTSSLATLRDVVGNGSPLRLSVARHTGTHTCCLAIITNFCSKWRKKKLPN